MAEPPINGERAFLLFLNQLGYGEAIADISREYETLVQDMHQKRNDRGGKLKGKMSLALTFALDDDGVMQVGYDVTLKRPPAVRPGAVLFINKQGELQASNPKQPELPHIRDVSEPRRRTKDAAAPVAVDADDEPGAAQEGGV